MLVGASRSRYASYPSQPIPLCAAVPLMILRPKSSVRVRLKYSLLVSFLCVVWFLTSAHSRTFLIACLSTLVGWNIFSSYPEYNIEAKDDILEAAGHLTGVSDPPPPLVSMT